MEAVSVTDMHKELHVAAGENTGDGVAALVETVKTAARLVPRQVNDEIALAKLELEHKKARLGGVAAFAGVALVFMALLVIALVVAAIAGLGTILPLWLSALIICGAMLLVIGISAFVAYRKFKALLPLLPENATRGIRHDLGIAKLGRDFDPATLEKEELSREEKKARKAEAAEAKARAIAEHNAKEAAQGPKATETELIARTAARREHLLKIREEIVAEADVKKLTVHALDAAKDKARETVGQAAAGAAGQAVETIKERWKPLAAFAVSSVAFLVLLRKLMKK